MTSFIPYNQDSDFSIHNIPFGVALLDESFTAAVTRIGDTVIDLATLCDAGYFDEFELPDNVFDAFTLNHFIDLGKAITVPLREKIQQLLQEGSELHQDTELQEEIFYDYDDVIMLMPVHVPNYTDFYSSIEHATNVGKMFRDPENALLPNWKHIPVGYHGRASSIVVSGYPITRPNGQTMPEGADAPVFGPTKRLDFELEMGFVVNSNTDMGKAISTREAEEYIFGMVLFNDWSARDIQKWEYVPLGPFLAKNFASTISPWIVTLEALSPYRVAGPKQDPEVLPYLQYTGDRNFDINLEVYIVDQEGNENLVSESNFKYMYWNMSQQLAHHTVNGCNVEAGDIYASGTISGEKDNSFGSMLELTWGGKKPLKMKDGTERKFIEDGDVVILKGFCEKDGVRVGFGEASAMVIANE
ncbi:MAG: fumarylacetoacetase [Weeksellaceae bacterium]|nr:fumarylacetoacetase [Weeksellaceae bacterium]